MDTYRGPNRPGQVPCLVQHESTTDPCCVIRAIEAVSGHSSCSRQLRPTLPAACVCVCTASRASRLPCVCFAQAALASTATRTNSPPLSAQRTRGENARGEMCVLEGVRVYRRCAVLCTSPGAVLMPWRAAAAAITLGFLPGQE
eukprot:6197112-Pleurochrysis_carterae.AAC.2